MGHQEFTPGSGVKCNIPNRVCKHDLGEGDRAKKISNHLFQVPLPTKK